MSSDVRLRREVNQLGRLFGDAIRRLEGERALALIESLRRKARRFADGDPKAGERLVAALSELSLEDLTVVVRAFSMFLELANLAEDRQRVRTLVDRRRKAGKLPHTESLRDAAGRLKQKGLSSSEVEALMDRVHVELVFTAHPTEAKRKSLRSKLREIRRVLRELDSGQLLPDEQEKWHRQLIGELTKLWKTDFIRLGPPTVMQEVERGLSFQPTLWSTVPKIYGELRAALAEHYPAAAINIRQLLSFGSWMGGDRDGHPYVTPEITAKTCAWLRETAIESHLQACHVLSESLSISRRQSAPVGGLEEDIRSAVSRWPVIEGELQYISVDETLRRWLAVIRWRLKQTAEVEVGTSAPAGSYASAAELAIDAERIRATLVASGDLEIAELELDGWLDQIAVFGFQTAHLDVRQHSAKYFEAITEIGRAEGLIAEGGEVSEAEHETFLLRSMNSAPQFKPPALDVSTNDTFELYCTARRLARTFGMAALGGSVVSMTRHRNDLLRVLWLWKWSEQCDGGHPSDSRLQLPIIPLFETIEDLKNATKILGDALATPAYRDAVRSWGDRQIVMIGYSDSTKDGGYLAASWGLYRAQIELQLKADAAGVRLTFFHGRGGSLGRGGGPTARAILSLPPRAFDGSLRLTEQGEILAERYDDAQIAHRHLEQVLWSVLVASVQDALPAPEAWHRPLDDMAACSYRAYRKLVDHPDFTTMFRQATPISEIEMLRIGSRPSRRVKSDRIEDLRAIPWVFAWTQSRCLLPAWYGLGAAIENFTASGPNALQQIRLMYREWPFMRATIDNAALAVAKSNRAIFEHYMRLAGTSPGVREIAQMIEDEWRRTENSLLAVIEEDNLLDDNRWLQRSIAVRDGYVGPLNLIQTELMQRTQESSENGESENSHELTQLRQLVVKGIAAGLRTTG